MLSTITGFVHVNTEEKSENFWASKKSSLRVKWCRLLHYGAMHQSSCSTRARCIMEPKPIQDKVKCDANIVEKFFNNLRW